MGILKRFLASRAYIHVSAFLTQATRLAEVSIVLIIYVVSQLYLQ